MKKCNICGKSISKFSSECPYCHNHIDTIVNSEIHKKRTEYKGTKANVITNTILSFILVFIFDVTLRMPGFTVINIIDVILEISCIAYSIFVLCNYKIISVSRNKALIFIAAVVGMLFVFLQIFISYRSYGLGIFSVEAYPLKYKFIRITEYILRSFLIAFIIFDVNYLVRHKKQS